MFGKCVGFGQCLDKPAAMEGFSATRGQKNHCKNRCAQICPNDAWKTVVAFQLMPSSRQERVP